MATAALEAALQQAKAYVDAFLCALEGGLDLDGFPRFQYEPLERIPVALCGAVAERLDALYAAPCPSAPATCTRTYVCSRETAEKVKRAYEKAGVSLTEGTFDLPGPSTPNRAGLHSPTRPGVANAPTRSIVLTPSNEADSD
jgi:hypothetical protein